MIQNNMGGLLRGKRLAMQSDRSRPIKRGAQLQQHALFRASEPNRRRAIDFAWGNTNQLEGARVRARCKNSARAALLLETRRRHC